MKKTIIYFLCCLTLSTTIAEAAILRCSCGSYETSITNYLVETHSQNEGCCSGTVIEMEQTASIKKFRWSEGAYMLVSMQWVEPAAAQRSCCNSGV